MIRLALNPVEQILDLDVDGDKRSFYLREQNVVGCVGFMRSFDLLRQDVARAESLDLLDQSPDEWEKVAAGADELIMGLLSRPEDPEKPADLAWVKALTLTQRQSIFDAQAKLNRLEDLAPNYIAILKVLVAARMAIQTLGDGAMNGSGGKSQLDSGPSLGSDPETSSTSGQPENASSTGASQFVSNGAP